jgi:hypothetical protein
MIARLANVSAILGKSDVTAEQACTEGDQEKSMLFHSIEEGNT